MKKLFYITFAFTLAAFFVGCKPIEIRDGVGDVVTSSDQINATVTSVVLANGKKSNKVLVHCTSPVTCHWTDGVINYVSTDTAMVLFTKGTQTITLTTRSADGTQFTKDFSVSVDSMHYPVPPQYGYFCGTGVKTWVWAVDHKYDCANRIWGNGGRDDGLPGWWGRTAADADQDGIDVNGTMTFTLQKLKFSRTEGGVTTTGNFSFDMNTHKTSKGIGQVTFIGTTILHGISQNDGKKVVYVFDIAKLTADEMILIYPTDGNNWENWFWLFKRQGFTY